MTHVRLFGLLIAGLCLLLAGSQAVSAIQVNGGSAVVNSLGETASMEIRLDSAPQGLSGYNISLALSNPGVAEIVDVSFPSWAGIHANTTLPADSVMLKAADLMDTAGTSNILLATVTLRGDAAGSTNLLITINANGLDDNDGDPMEASVSHGVFTVAVNSAPQLSPIGDKTVNEGSLLQFTVSATDTDVDALAYAALNRPSGAQFDPSTRVFSWTPSYSQAGSYSVNFTVTDGEFTDFEEITITVNNVNRAPVLDPIGNMNAAEDSPLQFTVSAADPDGDPLTYAAIATPSGATFNPSSRTFTWTPAYSQSGSYTVNFTVTDGSLWDYETITITVDNVNRAPLLDPVGDKIVAEGNLLEFIISATDPDGDSIAYGTASLPSGAAFDPSSRTFSWTPTYAQAGDYSVNFTATDGSLTDFEAIAITVTEVELNTPPELTSIGDKSVDEGQLLQFTVAATDPNVGDTLTFAALNLPTGATFDPSSRTFAWTPTYDQAGAYTVNFTVNDGALLDFEEITITVTDVNRAAVLDPIGNKNVAEGGLLQFTVSAIDPDGDTLIYAASDIPSGAGFDPLSRAFSWTPSYSQSGSYTVNFTVTDGELTDFEEITITVTDVNRAPVLDPIGNKNAAEGNLLEFTVSATDPDGDALTFAAIDLPSGAAFDPASRTFSWTPGSDQSGSYQVTFTVTDGSLTDSEEITITVTDIAVNTPPTLTPIGSKTVDEGHLLLFTISATDLDTDPLIYSALNPPAGATFDTGTQVFSWTPTYEQADSYSVNFTVTDGEFTDFEEITITVNNVNRAPVLDPIGDKNVAEGELLAFTVSASDPDGDALTYAAQNMPAGAGFDAGTRTFSWTPTFDQAGDYAVNVTVSDGALMDYEEIVITVTNVNRAPVLDPIGNKDVAEGNLLQFTVSATDPDGDALTYAAMNIPSGSVFDPSSRTFSWTPTNSQSGSYTLNFTVTDGSLWDYEEITITVSDVPQNLPPELAPIGPKTVNGEELLQFVVSATDPDGDSLTFTALNLPAGATFDPSSRTFAWTPAYDQAGSHPVNFTVTDGMLLDFEIVTITVEIVEQNAAPILDPIGDKTVNVGQTLDFAVSATDPDGDPLTFAASPLPDGASFDSAAQMFSWTPSAGQAGVYTVNVTVSDGDLEDWEIVTITVRDNTRLRADFSMNATEGPAPLAVQFTDRSSGNPTRCFWSFGDGVTSDAVNPLHVYQRAGSYTVRLWVWDGKKMDVEVKTRCITITPPALVAGFTADVESGPAPLKVHFTDTSTGTIRSRTWHFGDGSTSHAKNPLHVYQRAGTYTVRLVVSDGRTTDSEVKTDYITVTQPGLQADFTADPTSGTAPLKVHFKDQSSGPVQFRIWSFGDGSYSLAKNPHHVYRHAGTYTVQLAVFGKGGFDTEVKTEYIEVRQPNYRKR